jgi:hypothetical protein
MSMTDPESVVLRPPRAEVGSVKPGVSPADEEDTDDHT